MLLKVLLLFIFIRSSITLECFQDSYVQQERAQPWQNMTCGQCKFCAKTVSSAEKKTIYERWCGCRAEFQCLSVGLYRFNSAFDEYAVAHCCDSDFCNSTPSRYILFSIMLSISIFIVYT